MDDHIKQAILRDQERAKTEKLFNAIAEQAELLKKLAEKVDELTNALQAKKTK